MTMYYTIKATKYYNGREIEGDTFALEVMQEHKFSTDTDAVNAVREVEPSVAMELAREKDDYESRPDSRGVLNPVIMCDIFRHYLDDETHEFDVDEMYSHTIVIG